MAHRIAVMRAGRIVEEGEAEALTSAPRQPYTRALMAAAFELRAEEEGPAGRNGSG
jgi:microcin C transport system ATP-binding protein